MLTPKGNPSKRQELLGELDALLEEVDEVIEETNQSVLWVRCEQVLQSATPGVGGFSPEWVLTILSEEHLSIPETRIEEDDDDEYSVDNLGNTLSPYFRAKSLNNLDIIAEPPDGIESWLNDQEAWRNAKAALPTEKARRYLEGRLSVKDPHYGPAARLLGSTRILEDYRALPTERG